MGIATAQGKPYYLFTRWLRELNVKFDVLEPDRMEHYTGDVILTTKREVSGNVNQVILYDDDLRRGSAVALALLLERRGEFGRDLVIGIDPGQRLGLSIFYGGSEIERVLFVSINAMVFHISDIINSIKSTRCLIRIGNGDMHTAWDIHEALYAIGVPVQVEFVNEAGTSPRIRHCNRRGKRDMLAAREIAQRDPRITVAG